MRTVLLPEAYDDVAPDGSEIRLLISDRDGGVCHCTLEPGGVSAAVRHRNVVEIWYFLEGEGQVWRAGPEGEETVEVCPGLSLDIPRGTHFQFRNTGSEPLRFLITTMPPWPGPHEAVRVEDHWEVPAGAHASDDR